MINKIYNFIIKLFNKMSSVFYVGKTDKLPEPLSRELEDYYVSLKDSGDVKAKDILIAHNLKIQVYFTCIIIFTII